MCTSGAVVVLAPVPPGFQSPDAGYPQSSIPSEHAVNSDYAYSSRFPCLMLSECKLYHTEDYIPLSDTISVLYLPIQRRFYPFMCYLTYSCDIRAVILYASQKVTEAELGSN